MPSAFLLNAPAFGKILGSCGSRRGLARPRTRQLHECRWQLSTAAFERPGYDGWAKIRRNGFPAQWRGFDVRAWAEMWARAIESWMRRGLFLDRTEAKKPAGRPDRPQHARGHPGKRGAGSGRSRLLAHQKRPIAQVRMAALSIAPAAVYRDQRPRQVSASTVNKELN